MTLRNISIAAIAAAGIGMATVAMAPAKTVVEIAAGNKDFSTLVSLVKQAGLAETLSGKGPFTVFAPTNAAFAKLPKATLEAVGKDKELLKRVLTYHVVAGNVMAKDVVKLKEAKTVQGGKVMIAVRNGNVMLNGNVRVVKTDIVGSNGVIHVIDGVLMPPAKTANVGMTAVSNKAKGDCSSCTGK